MNRASRFGIYHAATSERFNRENDCACPVVPVVRNPQIVESTTRVHVHPDYQQTLLSDGHAVCYVMSHSEVAVLNHAAQELVQQLRKPYSLADLAEEEQVAAQTLLQLGLLQPVAAAPVMPSYSDELVAWLHVTNACNLRCTYCYLHKTDEAMTEDTAIAAIDAVLQAAQLHKYPKVQLKYAGGEASLNLTLVETMHAYALQQAQLRGLAVRGVVLSNGVGLTHQKLQRIRDAGLHLMISMDGIESSHDQQRPTVGGRGSYRAVLRSILAARELEVDLTISVTVTGKSISQLPDLIMQLLDWELPFSINFYREHDCNASLQELQFDAQQLIDGMRAMYAVIEQRPPQYSLLGCLLDRANLTTPHRSTCGVGHDYLVIDQHGSIAKCQMDISRSVTTIWDTDPLRTIRLDPGGIQALPVEAKEGCRSCEWRYWCAGGCPVATWRATGRYDVKSPNCDIYKALYPDLIRLEGTRILYWESKSSSR